MFSSPRFAPPPDEKSQVRVLQEFMASIVVFIVALPLCLGIAIASGLPPAAGLISGIIGGIVVGLISGQPLQVSGPAAGLVVVVWKIVADHGLIGLGAALVIAGLLQIFAGVFGLGRWFRVMSPTVIYAVLAGIGLLIVLSQFHVMFDLKPAESALANIGKLPQTIAHGLSTDSATTASAAAGLGVTTLLLMVLWNKFSRGRAKRVPAALIGVVVSSVAAWALSLNVNYIALPTSLAEGVRLPDLDFLHMFSKPELIFAGITMSLIASVETLLCASAVEKLRPDTPTRFDKELIAQGVGNMLCGFLGALPMTGVAVRSGANVDAGARTRFSTVLHGVWLLVAAAFFSKMLAHVPVASLAAVLVFTGAKLVDIQAVRRLASEGRAQVFIYAVTVVTILATNLLLGVFVGMMMAVVQLAYRHARLELEVKEKTSKEEGFTIRLAGVGTFLSLPALAHALDAIPAGSKVVFETNSLVSTDAAFNQYLSTWRARSGSVDLINDEGAHQQCG